MSQRGPLAVVAAVTASAAAVFLVWKAYRHYEKTVAGHEPSCPKNARKESRRLWALFAKEWANRLKHAPELASMLGDHIYSDQLSHVSPVAAAENHERLKEFLEELKTIDYDRLDASDQLNYNLFDRMLRVNIEEFKHNPYHWQGNQLFGPHLNFQRLVGFHPFRNSADVVAYISRLKNFRIQAKEFILSLQSGVDSGQTLPPNALNAMIAQCQMHVLKESGAEAKSPLYSPFASGRVSADVTAKYGEEVLRAIREYVSPAYQELAEFLSKTYLPKARKEAGVWSVPNGKSYYEFLVSYFTTTNLSAEQVHEIGLREVKQIKEQIYRVAAKLGYSGSFDDIQAGLKREESYFYQDPESIVEAYESFLKKVEARLPQFFSTLPEAKYILKKVEPYAEQKAPPAYYFPGEPSQSIIPPKPWLSRLFSKEEKKNLRPGFFYVNTYKPQERPIYNKETVALHEGVPGHHLQVSIAQELKGLPRFRTHNSDFMAYIEGWGLYSEWLGKDMGFFTDDIQEFGRLNADIWRSVRLVVDTGIHALRWTRDEAVQYMRQNTFLTDLEVNEEIDRYIVFPGQALSYKIGQLKILELRQHAVETLQEHFSYQEFHHQILSHGALPLDLLERNVQAWVSSKQKALGK